MTDTANIVKLCRTIFVDKWKKVVYNKRILNQKKIFIERLQILFFTHTKEKSKLFIKNTKEI